MTEDPRVKEMQQRRLTDPAPEWEAEYVARKMRPPVPPLPVRALIAAENLLDAWTHPRCLRNTADLLACVDQLVDTGVLGRTAAVIGCGPQPVTVRALAQTGYASVGVEPVEESVRQAAAYLEGVARVVPGTAERMPLEDGSQALVLLENVLEHVDSVPASLAECHRILKPGGVLFIRTTNRLRFCWTGINWEFTTRFYNWFPRMVRESYVFTQLHYRPGLAHYSPRPAVHWFSFPDLCDAGRGVGFARFYSPYDLLYLARRSATPSWLFRLRHWRRRHPWIRALAVSQMDGDIFMWKRPLIPT